MIFLLLFLMSYGLCFGLMNGKARILTDRLLRIPFLMQDDGMNFFARMLICPYCTGFHTGWISWLLLRGPHHYNQVTTPLHVVSAVTELIAVAYASSAVCYLLDTAAQWLEDSSKAKAE